MIYLVSLKAAATAGYKEQRHLAREDLDQVSTTLDAVVVKPDTLRVLDATVNRVTRTGKVLGADHRVSLLVGLKAQTVWSAYQDFEEKTMGSIEVGKLATSQHWTRTRSPSTR